MIYTLRGYENEAFRFRHSWDRRFGGVHRFHYLAGKEARIRNAGAATNASTDEQGRARF
jgi:hypothetical protein